MKVPLHVISAAHNWVRDESIAKDTHEVNRAFRAGAKYIMDMEANEAKTSTESESLVCYRCKTHGWVGKIVEQKDCEICN